MTDASDNLAQILEAAIFVNGEPLSISKMLQLFEEPYVPSKEEIREALKHVTESMQDRGVELVEVASGFRFQAKADYSPWLQKLWEKRPPRYSRALLETLALVAYRQPITRAEIEEIRGVSVSSNIVKILIDREWVKTVGFRDVPGRPELLATTKKFLDYFNLKKLSDLPPLEELKDLDQIGEALGMQLELTGNTASNPDTEAGEEIKSEVDSEVEAEAESESEAEVENEVETEEESIEEQQHAENESVSETETGKKQSEVVEAE